jgi:hypothetical protein
MGEEDKQHEERFRAESSPPGDFISEDLRAQTASFLDEVKRRLLRAAAEAQPKLGPPKHRKS